MNSHILHPFFKQALFLLRRHENYGALQRALSSNSHLHANIANRETLTVMLECAKLGLLRINGRHWEMTRLGNMITLQGPMLNVHEVLQNFPFKEEEILAERMAWINPLLMHSSNRTILKRLMDQSVTGSLRNLSEEILAISVAATALGAFYYINGQFSPTMWGMRLAYDPSMQWRP